MKVDWGRPTWKYPPDRLGPPDYTLFQLYTGRQFMGLGIYRNDDYTIRRVYFVLPFILFRVSWWLS